MENIHTDTLKQFKKTNTMFTPKQKLQAIECYLQHLPKLVQGQFTQEFLYEFCKRQGNEWEFQIPTMPETIYFHLTGRIHEDGGYIPSYTPSGKEGRFYRICEIKSHDLKLYAMDESCNDDVFSDEVLALLCDALVDEIKEVI